MTDNEIKKLLEKEHSDITEWIPLIQQYILERKGITVTINMPKNMMQHELYSLAWKTVFKYYANKLENIQST